MLHLAKFLLDRATVLCGQEEGYAVAGWVVTKTLTVVRKLFSGGLVSLSISIEAVR